MSVAVQLSDVERKRAANLQAVAALAGVRVDPIEADDGSLAWCVTRWTYTRQLNTLDEVADLLREMGLSA